jgi:hypothetical protein
MLRRTPEAPLKVILGRPLPNAVDVVLDTMDLGAPMLQVAKDGRLVEAPNEEYRRLVEKAMKR